MTAIVRADQVGSLLRPASLLRARRDHADGEAVDGFEPRSRTAAAVWP